MSEELVKFKGSAAGLQLTIAAGADIEDVLSELRDKLESEWGSRFFRRGTLVLLMPGVIPQEDEERFTKLFRQHGVFFRGRRGGAAGNEGKTGGLCSGYRSAAAGSREYIGDGST